MNCSRKDEIRFKPSSQRRLLYAITLTLWGTVILGIVYYFVVEYKAPERQTVQEISAPQREWSDVPIAEVGVGEEYQELELYGELYVLEYTLPYDSIWAWRDLPEELSSEAFQEEKERAYRDKSKDSPRHINPVPSPTQPPLRPGVISDWDYLFQRYGDEYGWDWCVLASIAYQESRLRADIVGMGGATGLMGIMPATGRRYGYSRAKLKHAETSIRVACMALRDFGRSFAHITDTEQRLKFTLASYNAGSAHVLDARRLAERDGLNPDRWDDSVALYMAHLDEPKYYKDPLVRHGRAHGAHTVRYVAEVFNRAQSYKTKIQYATAE